MSLELEGPVPTSGPAVGGSGTTGTIPKFTAASTLGNSLLSESGQVLTLTGGANAGLVLSASSGFTQFKLQANGVTKWSLNNGVTGTNFFNIQNEVLGSSAFSIDVANNDATATGNLTAAASNAAGVFTIGNASGNNQGRVIFNTSNTAYNWQVAANYNVSGGLELTPSTATGGSTFTTPALRIAGASGAVGLGTAPDANYQLTLNGGIKTNSGSTVFNEDGGDFDFRVEGDTLTSLIFADASLDKVGIGVQTTLVREFEVHSTAYPIVRLSGNVTAGSGDLADLEFLNRASNVGAYIYAYRDGADNSIGFKINTPNAGIGGDRVIIDKIGAVSIGTSPDANYQLTLNGGIKTNSGGTVFNEDGGDFDFRVEGDTDANLLFGDASTDRVGIGIALPLSKLHVYGGPIIADDATSSEVRLTSAGVNKWGLFQGLDGAGVFSLYDYTGTATRFKIDTSGVVTITGDTLVLATAKTPASAGAAGVAGQMAWDSDYTYTCVATNTWKRAAHATW